MSRASTGPMGGLIFLLLLVPVTTAQTDGESRILEVLAIGATLPQMTPVVPWLSLEPLTSVSHVPNRGFNIALPDNEYRRLVRVYLPRTYGGMLNYDAFLFVGGCVQFLSSNQVSWLKTAVSDGGRSALGDLGGVSTVDYIVSEWISSGMWEIFPSNAPGVVTRGDWSRSSYWTRVIPGRENNPLDPFVDLGVEKVLGGGGRFIIPRAGSLVYAQMQGISFAKPDDPPLSGYDNPPFLVAWDYEDGRTMLVAEFLNHPWWHTPNQGGRNTYAQDVLINLLLNAVHRPVFQDIPMLHAVRIRIQEFYQRYTIVLSTLDFVERFGAGTNSIRLDLEETLQLEALASSQYLDLDVGGAMQTLEEAIKRVNLLIVGSMDLKDRALFWIYIIEWFFVTGTLMASGSLLYTVMVKRRLYRATVHTRFRSRD